MSFPASLVDHHNNISFEKESGSLLKLSAKTVTFRYFGFAEMNILQEDYAERMNRRFVIIFSLTEKT